MATITCKEDLEGYTLEAGDVVIFRVEGEKMEYKVFEWFLSKDGYNNGRIFTLLSLNKNTFCSNAYGYNDMGGSWPTYKCQDYKAATRVVDALYVEIEKRDRQKRVAGLASTVTYKSHYNPKNKKSFMSTITEKLHNLTLSKNDRLLRSLGLEDETGKPTSEGFNVLCHILYSERREDIIKKAKELAKEDEKDA